RDAGRRGARAGGHDRRAPPRERGLPRRALGPTRRGLRYRVERPVAGDAFERNLSAVDELEARPGHQILHRLRDENLARARLCHHARPQAHRDATDFPGDDLALTYMDPDAHVDADLSNAIADRHRAVDRP